MGLGVLRRVFYVRNLPTILLIGLCAVEPKSGTGNLGIKTSFKIQESKAIYMQLTFEQVTGSVANLKITSRQEMGMARSLALSSSDLSSPCPDTKGSKNNTDKLELKSLMSLFAYQSLLI